MRIYPMCRNNGGGVMKKPKIVLYKTVMNQWLTMNGRAKGLPELKEMIEETTDALIESTKLLEGIKSVTDDPKYLYEIEQQIEMNKYSALRKAGVEL